MEWILPRKGPSLPTPLFPASCLQNWERINLCCLSHPLVVICYDSPRKRLKPLKGEECEVKAAERGGYLSETTGLELGEAGTGPHVSGPLV